MAKKMSRGKSRMEMVIDAILEGGYAEDELEEIISICESELSILREEIN